LRNVAATAPYFHDGSAATLEIAVSQMAGAQLDVDLSIQETADIAAFLRTLTGRYAGKPVQAPR
jgi:cytochrome c peroxidase